MDVLITSTSTAGLLPVGTASSRSHVVLTETLRNRLSEDHAALFSDPVQTGFGDRLDWYSSKSGTISTFASLNLEDSNFLRDEVVRLTRDVSKLGEDLKASGDPQDFQLGTALLQAIEIPSEASIYAVRGIDNNLSPVLVNWGFVAGAETEVRGVLTGLARKKVSSRNIPLAAAAPLSSALLSPAPHRSVGMWPWILALGWLLLGLILATILWLLVRPCGLNPGQFVFFCPSEIPIAASSLEADRLILDDEIAALERELSLQNRSCQPSVPVAPPIVQEARRDAPGEGLDESGSATGDLNDALDERLEESGAEIGDLSFALFWDRIDDLDLFVTCPGGAEIYYGKRSACGGTLDVDANSRSQRLSDPVENIFFSNPDPGTYKVRVHLHSDRSDGPKAFTLRVRQRNGTVQNFRGQVSSSRPNWHQTITVTE